MRTVFQIASATLLVTGACAAAVRTSPPIAAPAADLRDFASRGSELNGRWVEFDAYVYPWRQPPFLVALPGEEESTADGSRRMMCRAAIGTDFPVFFAHGYGPLRRRDIERPVNLQPRVRIRAVFHNSAYRVSSHWVTTAWSGYFDHASIVEVTGQQCHFDPPR